MAEWVDLLDSINQKYDPAGTSLGSTNVQAAISELDAKPVPGVDLSNAEFPDYAVFDGLITADATVDFTDGNKQTVNAATYNNVTVAAPSGHPANFMLRIINAGSLASIVAATEGNILWDEGTPPEWGGLTILALFYDGGVWYGSAMVNVA